MVNVSRQTYLRVFHRRQIELSVETQRPEMVAATMSDTKLSTDHSPWILPQILLFLGLFIVGPPMLDGSWISVQSEAGNAITENISGP